MTPTKRVRLPRTEEPRWREYGLFQAYTVAWKSRNEAKRKKITSALERPGSARGLPMWRARALERRARALGAPAPWSGAPAPWVRPGSAPALPRLWKVSFFRSVWISCWPGQLRALKYELKEEKALNTSPGQGTPPLDRVRLQVMWCSITTARNEFPNTFEEGAPPGKILIMLSHVIANKSVVV